MKTCVLFFLLSCHAAAISVAEIRNGYDDIDGAHASLLSIRKLLREGKSIPLAEKQTMKHKKNALEHYIIYHRLTERLLIIFRTISPELYAEIDTLKDSKGRSVHVYVKFVAEKNLPAGVYGATNVAQDVEDPHIYRSEYGLNSVSVVIVAGNKSLVVLAHEFGHVQYQAQNLVAYVEFYNKFYGQSLPGEKSIGHNDRDDSGKKAKSFVSRFQGHYLNYLRGRNNKPESHLSLLQGIEKDLKSKGVI